MAMQGAQQQRTKPTELEGIKHGHVDNSKDKCSILEDQGEEVVCMLAGKWSREKCRDMATLKRGCEIS